MSIVPLQIAGFGESYGMQNRTMEILAASWPSQGRGSRPARA